MQFCQYTTVVVVRPGSSSDRAYPDELPWQISLLDWKKGVSDHLPRQWSQTSVVLAASHVSLALSCSFLLGINSIT